MTTESDDWKIIEYVFAEAIELPQPERDAFIQDSCADRPDLIEELQCLLEAHAQSDDFLDNLDTQTASELLKASEESVETKIGAYRIVQELGRGGMGIVYLAERDDGQFEQQVALKLIKRGMDSDEILRRFLNERQILANLQHPNIAQLLDGGVSEQGQPYFAMEYIEGTAIIDYCNQHGLSVNQRLKLFIQACKAIQHAHNNLIIHRDIKPSNILVTATGVVKLVDFGIAKLVAEDTTSKLTQTNQRMMTPEYSAPEQVNGTPVTTATDVYSLGVVLYELLTGERPYVFEDRSLSEILRLVCETNPSKPSTSVVKSNTTGTDNNSGKVTNIDNLNTNQLAKKLRGDLDTIVMMALKKEPERRYTSPLALAEDIERFIDNKAVSARSDSSMYQFGKFLRRHLIASSIVTISIFSIISGLSYALWQEHIATQEMNKARASSEFLLDLLKKADPANAQGKTTVTIDVLDLAAKQLEGDENPFTNQPEQTADLLHALGKLYISLGQFDKAVSQLHRSKDLLTKKYGTKHRKTITPLETLAKVKRLQGHYSVARGHAKRVLDIKRIEFGVDHVSTIKSKIQLAHIWRDSSKYKNAEKLYLEAYNDLTNKFGKDHKKTIAITHYLSILFRRQGLFNKAEEYALKSYHDRLKVLGEKHPETLYSMYNLSTIYKQQARYDKSLELALDSVDKMLIVLGSEHPYTLVAKFNLASIYRRTKKLEQAKAIINEIKVLQKKILGADHRQTMLSTAELAHIAKAQGNFKEAQALYKTVLKKQTDILGYTHRHTLLTKAGQASLYTKLKLYPEARTLYNRHMGTFNRYLGRQHPNTIKFLNDYVALLIEMNETQRANTIANEIFISSKTVFGKTHPVTDSIKKKLNRLENNINQKS